MKPQNNTAQACKPQFFKVLFPDPFANLLIPRKFHVNLPHKLQKLATLFSPAGKFWHVETCCTGEDMYFQKGWSEFAKAHNLQTGYFMVFRYEGNMIFKVKIFDLTGCLKNYSLASHARLASPCIEIESSSESGDQTPSESPHEFKSDILKKRKLEDSEAVEIDKRKSGSTSQETLKDKKDTKEKNVDSNRQFKRILWPYCFSRPFLYIPMEFCVNNGLQTGHTINLKDNSSGERLWPVSLCVRPNRGELRKGWKQFRDAAGLKEGDQCIFRLESKNVLVVTVIPQESKSRRKRKGKATEESTSSAVAFDEKQIQQNEQYSRPTLNILKKRKFTNGQALETDERKRGSTSQKTLKEKKDTKDDNVDSDICSRQFVRILKPCCFSRARLYIPKKFCVNNGLKTGHTIYLKDNSSGGRLWPVSLCVRSNGGQLNKGWKEFTDAAGLKEGDLCIFQLESKNILVVTVDSNSRRERKGKAREGSTSSVVALDEKQIQQNKHYSRPTLKFKSNIVHKRKFTNGQALETDERNTWSTSLKTLKEKKDPKEENVDSNICSRQFERILMPYCFSRSRLFISKAFCMNNGLLTRHTIYLKENSSGGRSWPVNLGNGYLTKGWEEFREAAGLKEGDRCIFRLVSENSLVVTVIPQESDSTRVRKGKAIEGFTSSVVAKEEKQIQKKKQYSRLIIRGGKAIEWESTVRPYHLTYSYQNLGKTFCLDNNLISPRDITLRDLTGKEWHAKFYFKKSEGRLDRASWSNFSREHRLNVGDKCIFKVVQEDVLLIRVIKK